MRDQGAVAEQFKETAMSLRWDPRRRRVWAEGLPDDELTYCMEHARGWQDLGGGTPTAIQNAAVIDLAATCRLVSWERGSGPR
jgi:hypothetical protein